MPRDRPEHQMNRQHLPMFSSRHIKPVLFAIACGIFTLPSLAQVCGSLKSNYGPFDYRVDQQKLPVVENRHFTPKIEALIGGESTAAAGPDIEYTLRAFPNHTRALAAVMRLGQRHKTNQPKELAYSVDCHFERALRFRNDDVVVRMMWVQWLGQTQRRAEALRQLSLVEHRGDPMTLQNLGLLYADLGEYDLAAKKAREAQQMGFSTPILLRILEEAGQWRTIPPEVELKKMQD